MNPRAALNPGVSPRRSETWWPALAIAVLTIAAYLPALRAGFIWDDDAYVTHNAVLTEPGGLWRIWFEPTATIQYYPLVFTSFWMEHRVWGLEPLGYHAVNIVLHAINAVLVWRILLVLQIPGAILAACIFAVHPVNAESVAWVTERKNVLSLAFYLSSALAFPRFADIGMQTDSAIGPPGHRGTAAVCVRRNYRWLAASLALFAFALLSKTATLTLPIALLLLAWWRRPAHLRSCATALLAFLPLVILSAWMTTGVEREQVGAGEMDWSLSWPQRLLLACRSTCFYLGKLLWPTNLAFVYHREEIDPLQWHPYLCGLGLLAAAVILWAGRSRWGWGPLVAMAFFVISLGPVLGFIPFFFMTYSFVADHFVYIASVGPIALLGAIFARVSARSPLAHRGTRALAVAIIAALAILTFRRCGVFENQETLWKDVLAKSPSAARQAHDNLAVYYAGIGRLDDAAVHYRASLEQKADQPEVLSNLGTVLYQLGRKREAAAAYGAALRIRPAHAEAHCNLALLLSEQGDFEGAFDHYQSAIASRPGFATAHFNLARLLASRGRLAEAAEEYREVLRIHPQDPDALRELASMEPKLRSPRP